MCFISLAQQLHLKTHGPDRDLLTVPFYVLSIQGLGFRINNLNKVGAAQLSP